MKRPSVTSKICIAVVALLGVTTCIFFFKKYEIQKPPVNVPTSVADVSLVKETPIVPVPQKYEYVQVTGGCGPHFEGQCLHVRSGPGVGYPIQNELRNGIILKVAGKVTDASGVTWYKITFDEWLRYPERVSGDWYVSGDYVRDFFDVGNQTLSAETAPNTTQHIVINLTQQMLYAYDGDSLFLQTPVSTGVPSTPTPVGTFHVFRKMTSRYMQGPIPGASSEYFDVPGVPWVMYFTEDGDAIHGAYWHTDFGTTRSNGCVNVSLDMAQKLYAWTRLGAEVKVEN